ncbi:hypothetical protein SCYAM73S_08084 [Streptomyces cyaneofuscatus]
MFGERSTRTTTGTSWPTPASFSSQATASARASNSAYVSICVPETTAGASGRARVLAANSSRTEP